MKHLRSISELGADGLSRILKLTESMAEINTRAVPKVPALRGKTVVSLFFEDSTRTRLSFETAAKRLSAETMNFSVSTSSVNKGESLRDTIETITDMGVDAFVVRHKSVGVPWQISQWTDASIVNAGDGAHQHPTQALVDCFTVREALGRQDLSGLNLTIVGDIKHSRVARSNIQAFSLLGANITLVAPPTLLPLNIEHWPVKVSNDLDAVLASTDVLYMLRLQSERMAQGLVPSLYEYSTRYGLDEKRVAALQSSSVVMHPGPMNRGVEMLIDPSDIPNSLIHRQVTNGVSVRMAVLFDLLSAEELS
ncbi:MAG: aspartate carbamoyltransferase catalytic subunit [Actinobacteria bacterium]|uniref:aspartate carbamoyltransferase n=1 Tax=freshwater metagenome TaxID=449393 RepID=A0A6J6XJJ7_9ZZZZ|nr:aspartate carbamoyltransferase catalytic subunit [Actinomycetota bacterium]